MRPIVTDRVAWSVCRSVTDVSPAKTARDAVWDAESGEPRELCVRRVQVLPLEGALLGECLVHCKAYGTILGVR